MKDTILFIKQLFKNKKQIGAIIPSSIYLAKNLLKKEIINSSKTIVEIGAGTGVFTKELSRYNLEGKKVIIIEINKEFCKKLEKDFPSFIIVNDDILNIDKIMKKYNIEKIDLIISGIPFKSLPENLFHDFMKKLKNILSDKGYFLQFSYFKNSQNNLKRYFKNIESKKIWYNIPPAHIFTCYNYKK